MGFHGLSLGRQYEPATDMVSEAHGYDHGSADVQNSAEEDQSLECPRQLFSLELPGTQVFAAIQLASHLHVRMLPMKRTFSSSEHYVPIEPIRIPPHGCSTEKHPIESVGDVNSSLRQKRLCSLRAALLLQKGATYLQLRVTEPK